jgi:hypothetical protein
MHPAQVEVALPSGRSVALPIAPISTGQDLKQYIALLLGASADAVSLQCTSSCHFLGAGTLQRQAVQPGAKLTARLRPGRPGAQVLLLSARDHASITGQAGGQAGARSCVLLHLRACGGCQLKSLPRNGCLAAGRLRLWVKTLTGKTIDLRLSPDSSVEELKIAIMDKEDGWAGMAGWHGWLSSAPRRLQQQCCRQQGLPALLPQLPPLLPPMLASLHCALPPPPPLLLLLTLTLLPLFSPLACRHPP